jgi:ElaB/YqjD/DUF883 family membrane-anchored ribosome-binding protein
MAMADTDMTGEIRKLREDFSSLKKDLSSLMVDVREHGASRFEDAKDSASENLRATGEQLRRRVQHARVRGQETVDDLGETIGGHPLQSVAMAFGFGFIVAKLMDGSRR